MINIDQPKFDGCRRIYMAANTPTFLVKKLRIERSVLDLHLRYSKEQLIEMVVHQHYSIYRASKKLKISNSTAKSVIKNY